MARARTTTGVSRQAGNAFFAAWTAASRSSPVESGVFAITSPVAGLWTSSDSAAREAIHRPPTKLVRVSKGSPSVSGSGSGFREGGFYSSQSGQPRNGIRSAGAGCASPSMPAQAPPWACQR